MENKLRFFRNDFFSGNFGLKENLFILPVISIYDQINNTFYNNMLFLGKCYYNLFESRHVDYTFKEVIDFIIDKTWPLRNEYLNNIYFTGYAFDSETKSLVSVLDDTDTSELNLIYISFYSEHDSLFAYVEKRKSVVYNHKQIKLLKEKHAYETFLKNCKSESIVVHINMYNQFDTVMLYAGVLWHEFNHIRKQYAKIEYDVVNTTNKQLTDVDYFAHISPNYYHDQHIQHILYILMKIEQDADA